MNKDAKKLYKHASLLVEYDPEAGVFTWAKKEPLTRNDKAWNGQYAGKECGHTNPAGYKYLTVTFDGRKRKILLHRLAWYICQGQLPAGEIDHINQIRGDNRIVNLRDVTIGENAKNQTLYKTNTSGVTGVWWSKKSGKWQAKVQVNGKAHHVGLFDDLDDAKSAVIACRKKMGFTDRHGIEREAKEES